MLLEVSLLFCVIATVMTHKSSNKLSEKRLHNQSSEKGHMVDWKQLKRASLSATTRAEGDIPEQKCKTCLGYWKASEYY